MNSADCSATTRAKNCVFKCARKREKQKTRAGIGWKDKELITEYLDP